MQTAGASDAPSSILSGFSVGGTPPLPEAPASINCRLMIAGRDCQLTLRDTSETRLLTRLEAVLRRFPVAMPAPGTAAPQIPVCDYHGPLKQSTKAPGTFYCPVKMADSSYCQSRWPTKDGGRRA